MNNNECQESEKLYIKNKIEFNNLTKLKYDIMLRQKI